MRMSDLIVKKRDGQALTTEEIRYMIDGYSRGEIPDYQMSAMTMAIYFRGMDRRETLDLTMAMMHSGETLDLSGVSGVKADKHSTGGVGDKTSLVLVPMVASLGVKMAKMSGRGLGHTGGTLDKLESIPGFNINLPMERFLENVDRVGMVIAGQTANLDPADKKLYALRDVTGTVASIPLIVSSIMSKKLAAGADIIVLDVKCGSGSFMKTLDDARELATEMVEIGKMAGRKTVAVITDMDEPLGHAVGNALEVKEAIAALRGEYKSELLELCLTLGSCILTQAGMAADDAAARACWSRRSRTVRRSKSWPSLSRRRTAIRPRSMTRRACHAPVQMEVPSPASGYVRHIAATDVGLVSMRLGGGRATKDSVIDHSVGIVLRKKVDEPVTAGESLATIHAADEAAARRAVAELTACYTITRTRPRRSRSSRQSFAEDNKNPGAAAPEFFYT